VVAVDGGHEEVEPVVVAVRGGQHRPMQAGCPATDRSARTVSSRAPLDGPARVAWLIDERAQPEDRGPRGRGRGAVPARPLDRLRRGGFDSGDTGDSRRMPIRSDRPCALPWSDTRYMTLRGGQLLTCGT
jgi:hypothetical protein